MELKIAEISSNADLEIRNSIQAHSHQSQSKNKSHGVLFFSGNRVSNKISLAHSKFEVWTILILSLAHSRLFISRILLLPSFTGVWPPPLPHFCPIPPFFWIGAVLISFPHTAGHHPQFWGPIFRVVMANRHLAALPLAGRGELLIGDLAFWRMRYPPIPPLFIIFCRKSNPNFQSIWPKSPQA